MDKKVDDYVEKQKSPQKEICTSLRKIVLKTFPGTTEEMKWGVPVYGGGKIYIGAVKLGVNLGVSVKGMTDWEINEFSGKGRIMRHIKIMDVKDINEKEIVRLLRLVRMS